MHLRLSRALLAVLAALSVAACGRDVAFVDPRAATDPADSTDDDSTIVVRGNLAVTVSIAPGDSAIARALGLPGLALPGANVTARRLGQPLREGLTDSAGQVTFEALVTGPWAVSVVRVLTPEERALMPPGAEDVVGFAAGGSAQVVESGTAVTIGVTTGRQGGVVISEVYAPIYQVPSQASYGTGQYFEFYNNGFDTLYLDGLVVGRLEHPSDNNRETCEQRAVQLEDPLGLWVRYFNRFPGTGRDYPLPPGRAVVVATDAIDHTQFVPGLQDLSWVSFEFLGPADVDNPAVPNMVDIGTQDCCFGHGLWITGGTVIGLFLARPVDPDTLPTWIDPFGWTYVRIPGSAVLDVFTSWPTPELEAATLCPACDYCDRMVNPVFDQEPARLQDYRQLSLGVRRKVLSLVPWVILQRTGSSAADLETGPPTPESVP